MRNHPIKNEVIEQLPRIRRVVARIAKSEGLVDDLVQDLSSAPKANLPLAPEKNAPQPLNRKPLSGFTFDNGKIMGQLIKRGAFPGVSMPKITTYGGDVRQGVADDPKLSFLREDGTKIDSFLTLQLGEADAKKMMGMDKKEKAKYFDRKWEDQVKSGLALEEFQKEEWDRVHKEFTAKKNKIRDSQRPKKEKRAELAALTKERSREMEGILTPKQQKVYDEYMNSPFRQASSSSRTRIPLD